MSLTIPSSQRKAGPYTATAGQTDFDFTFPVLDAGDLVVTRDRGGIVAVLALSTDYVVTGVGDQAGGTVVLQTGAEAGDIIAIDGDLDPQRGSDFQYAGGKPLKSGALDTDMNRLTIMVQELWRQAKRAVVRSPLDTVADALQIPHDEASILLGLNENRELQGFATVLFSGLEALKVQEIETTGASLTIDLAKGTYAILDLKHDVTDLIIQNWPSNAVLGRLMLEVRQTGSFNITDWDGAKWAGSAPTLTTGDGARDVVMLHTPDAGANVYGNVIGLNYTT